MRGYWTSHDTTENPVYNIAFMRSAAEKEMPGLKSKLCVVKTCILVHREVSVYMFSPGIKSTSNVFDYNIAKNVLILYILLAFCLE